MGRRYAKPPPVLSQHADELAANQLRPAVDSVFPWTDIAAALERLRQARHFGKIVLKF
jgi:NADPH:quinone reductase-like Zn-dependent oxidoreductase